MSADSPAPADPASRGLIIRFLDGVEKVGNRLPQPATLMFYLCLIVLGLSAIGAALQVKVTFDAVQGGQLIQRTVEAKSLLTLEGFHYLINATVPNFIGFPPLGTVLVAFLGIVLAEVSGLLGAAIKAVVLVTPRQWLTAVLVFLGVMSNLASDVGYLVLVPLAGAAFLAVGRHPLVGMAAAFAGVSGGFSANLLPGSLDALLGGITQPAAQIKDSSYQISVLANWYFLAGSTFLIVLLGWFVTEKIVAPRLGDYRGDAKSEGAVPLTKEETRGLWVAGGLIALLSVVLVAGLLPGSFLRDAKGEIVGWPALPWVVPLIFLYGVVMGIGYGIAAGTLKTEKAIINAMGKGMETMAPYIVFAFFSAQFIAWFNWTGLGTILAVNGANLIKAVNLSGPPLFILFMLVVGLVNLLMSSASAKWAVLAPIMVPMFMLLGYSPETTQAAYRVGDSTTNIITPLLPYLPIIVGFAQRYDPKAGLGTFLSLMLPYSIAFFLGWSIFFIAWYSFGLPLGPGVPIHYTMPTVPVPVP